MLRGTGHQECQHPSRGEVGALWVGRTPEQGAMTTTLTDPFPPAVT